MRIVIATDGLSARGGIHSYLDAVLGELVALDHEVHVVAPVFGRPETISGAGAVMHSDLADVPRPVDGVIAFFDFSALEARAAFPDVPLLQVSHGSWYAQDAPTALVEPCAAIALSDPSLERLEQSVLAEAGVPIVRLTQPADFRTPPPPNVLPDSPAHAVIVAHRLATRREPLLRELRERGIHTYAVGGAAYTEDVLDHVLAADVVVGIGRVIVEGMATGRACLVLDEVGGGAWLTPETYPEFEASGFFLGPGMGVAPEDLGALIDGYRPELGRAGRELALAHHAPAAHAARLIALLRAAGPPQTTFDPAALLAEAARRHERYDAYFAGLAEDWAAATRRRDLNGEARLLVRYLTRENERLVAELDRERAERRAEVDELNAAHWAQLEQLYGSRSWRVTRPLRRIGELTRERRAPR